MNSNQLLLLLLFTITVCPAHTVCGLYI